jgi:hypothetical protein
MNQRRHRSDDVLFIAALAAILLGIALLLYTTHTFVGAPRAWPLIVIAVGGLLLYFAFVRRASFYVLFGGLLFVLEGVFFLASILLGWKIAKAWPLGMAIAGFAGLVSGLAARRRITPLFGVPSLSFAFLGLIFSAFSFGLIRINFRSFITVWWPTLLIAGGISLFVAYGLSRRTAAKRAEDAEGRARERAAKAPGPRSRHERGPSSGP